MFSFKSQSKDVCYFVFHHLFDNDFADDPCDLYVSGHDLHFYSAVLLISDL